MTSSRKPRPRRYGSALRFRAPRSRPRRWPGFLSSLTSLKLHAVTHCTRPFGRGKLARSNEVCFEQRHLAGVAGQVHGCPRLEFIRDRHDPSGHTNPRRQVHDDDCVDPVLAKARGRPPDHGPRDEPTTRADRVYDEQRVMTVWAELTRTGIEVAASLASQNIEGRILRVIEDIRHHTASGC